MLDYQGFGVGHCFDFIIVEPFHYQQSDPKIKYLKASIWRNVTVFFFKYQDGLASV